MTLTMINNVATIEWLDDALPTIHRVIAAADSSQDRADGVADVLRHRLPSPAILSADQRRGRADGYQQHILHIDPSGAFSVVALVWLPGQTTPVHDHVCWGAVAVLTGVEGETTYEWPSRRDGDALVKVATRANYPGEVTAFAPPGDIHEVQNIGSRVAVSLHVYGADLSVRGSSIRRTFRHPGPATSPGPRSMVRRCESTANSAT